MFQSPIFSCFWQFHGGYMGVSKNNGTPKSSGSLRVFHDFHHPFWGGNPLFLETSISFHEWAHSIIPSNRPSNRFSMPRMDSKLTCTKSTSMSFFFNMLVSGSVYHWIFGHSAVFVGELPNFASPGVGWGFYLGRSNVPSAPKVDFFFVQNTLPRKVNMANGNITIFNRKYIFIHGRFQIVMLVFFFWGGGVVILCFIIDQAFI